MLLPYLPALLQYIYRYIYLYYTIDMPIMFARYTEPKLQISNLAYNRLEKQQLQILITLYLYYNAFIPEYYYKILKII
jgi:hypothetical protein